MDAAGEPGTAEGALLSAVDATWASGGLRHRLTVTHMLVSGLVTVHALLRWVLAAGTEAPPVLVSESAVQADAGLDVMRDTLHGLVDSVPVWILWFGCELCRSPRAVTDVQPRGGRPGTWAWRGSMGVEHAECTPALLYLSVHTTCHLFVIEVDELTASH